ncbi:GNAT family N-acetyltransferase [Variovorax paradoxus]|nr:GNAT family N-acetyltransferase [Variovorax paradoxus]
MPHIESSYSIVATTPPIVTAQWITQFDEDTCDDIISLIDMAVRDGGTLGYSNPLDPEEAEGFLANLERRVVAGEAHVLLGRAEGVAVMMAVLSLNGMHNCCHRAEISKGVVHPAFRGRRLVELALKKLVERAELFGVEQLVLDVREHSRAHALWTRFGFVTYGVLDDYARTGGQRFRGHFMMQTTASLRSRLSMKW